MHDSSLWAPVQSNDSSSSAVQFGGGLAGTAGGTAPRSAVLLAQMRSRQAAINAAAVSAARNDPEVRGVLTTLC